MSVSSLESKGSSSQQVLTPCVTGFAVEYAVHIIARWLRADMSHVTSLDRVEYTMSFLMLPTFMSFISSTIGVVCLAFTEFEFNQTFFFKPLIIVMVSVGPCCYSNFFMSMLRLTIVAFTVHVVLLWMLVPAGPLGVPRL